MSTAFLAIDRIVSITRPMFPHNYRLFFILMPSILAMAACFTAVSCLTFIRSYRPWKTSSEFWGVVLYLSCLTKMSYKNVLQNVKIDLKRRSTNLWLERAVYLQLQPPEINSLIKGDSEQTLLAAPISLAAVPLAACVSAFAVAVS
jgi:hypothetical protein